MSELRWRPSETYEIKSHPSGAVLRRRKADSLSGVRILSEIIVAIGTPLASLVVGKECAWLPIVGGMVLAITSLLSAERRALRPHVVTAPGTIKLARSTAAEGGYRDRVASTGSIVVDGVALDGEVPLGVVVMERAAKGGVFHVVAVVTTARAIHLELTQRVDLANDLAANVRETLGLRAVLPSALGEPAPPTRSAGALVAVLCGELALIATAPMFGILFTPKDVTIVELVLRAGAIGIGLVLLDRFAGVLLFTAFGPLGPSCLARTKELLERQAPAEPEPRP